MEYLNCKKIDTAISRAKTMLIKKAKEKGIYENFGKGMDDITTGGKKK